MNAIATWIAQVLNAINEKILVFTQSVFFNRSLKIAWK